jgi:glycosyltransferase involved in cell wall biosynthesis
MKLLYFSGSTLPSGYANAVHVMKMCAALAGKGHEVTLYAKAGRDQGNVFEYYDVEPSFEIIRSSNIHIPALSGFLRSAHTLFYKKSADLIYGRDLWTMAAVADSSTPIAFELHEIPHAAFQKEMLRRILKAKNLKGLIVITQGLKADLLAFAPEFPSSKIRVAADGADLPTENTVPPPLEKITGTDFQVGYGGSLYKGKGIELIIQIAARAPHIGFHVFGGPEAEKQKWLAQKPPANIRFYGHIPHGGLTARLAACDALIAPYMPAIHIGTGADISRWISPLKLFEYMAVKKPIICSDLPVLREVMEHGRNALLIDPEIPERWVEAIEQLRGEPETRGKLALGAYQDLETRYSWDQRAKAILKFLAS